MLQLLFKLIFNINKDFRFYILNIANLNLDKVLNLSEEESFKYLNDFLKWKN